MRRALVAAATLLVASVAAGDSRKDEIVKAVKSNSLELHACYEEAIARDPKLEGKVVVEFTVEKGKITDATVVQTTLDDVKTEACILTTMKTWAFPLVKGTVSVTYPFVFKR